MNATQACEYVLDTHGRWIKGHPEETKIRELLRAVADVTAEPKTPSSRVGEALLAQITPAAPGWRLAVLDYGSGTVEALPIVAWSVTNAGTVAIGNLTLEPLCRIPSEQGARGVELNGGYADRVVGILAPGEELDRAWHEAGEELEKVLREG